MSAARERGVCPVRTFCEQGEKGVVQMRTFALFGAKNFRISKFMACPHGQGGSGFEPVRTREKGVNFLRTSFMDDPN